MRRLVPVVAVAVLVAGCSGLLRRGGSPGGYGPSSPVPQSRNRMLTPVPDLGMPQSEPLPSESPAGPVLEGPIFPEGSRGRSRWMSRPATPASSRVGRVPDPIPLSGYYELPPAP